ncbi:hypothetical protein [Bacteroides togonis]|uniref:hypothetical protein n=1 Tax=Bacteroides togonis TaxID=1917883 RepID=UPI00094B744A|nr:hypothetical protein [Bacteroides togonis]
MYILEQDGAIWAKKQISSSGRVKSIVHIDTLITSKLKAFLNGQTCSESILDEEFCIVLNGKSLIKDDVVNSDTITRIAQDENGDVLAFEFVKANEGCDFTGIVEQDIILETNQQGILADRK